MRRIGGVGHGIAEDFPHTRAVETAKGVAGGVVFDHDSGECCAQEVDLLNTGRGQLDRRAIDFNAQSK